MFAHVDSLRVVLEGLSGFHRRAQASKDAAGWLTQRLTTAVFAVNLTEVNVGAEDATDSFRAISH